MARLHQYRILIASIKILTGTFEILSGLFLLFSTKGSLERLVGKLTQFLAHSSPKMSSTLAAHMHHLIDKRATLAIILLVLGVVKLIAAVGFLKHRPWGYYLLVAVLIAYVPYDVYELTKHVGPFVVATLVIDLVIISLMLYFKKAFLTHEHETKEDRPGN
jgi:uncharacterized membrane protein (DUF2068 family)